MSSQGLIKLDWAFIFDLLSVSEVKTYKLENGEKRDIVLKSIENLWNEMEKQLGFQKLMNIYQSKEYEKLYDVNRRTWDAVELAERGQIEAIKVANCNTERHFHKSQLQKKFFDNPLTEQKGRA